MYKRQGLMGDTPTSMAGKLLGENMHFILSKQNTRALKEKHGVLFVEVLSCSWRRNWFTQSLCIE